MRLYLFPVVSLLATTVLLPLALLALGFWEWERGAADRADLEAERAGLVRFIEDLDAQTPLDGHVDYRIQFRRNGELYGGALAVAEARKAGNQVAILTKVMRLREALPPVVVWAAGVAAVLSALVLLAGTVLGRLGQTSREALVRGFAVVRRVLPGLLAVQVALGTTAFMAAVLFEAGALVQPALGTGELRLLFLAGVVVLCSLYGAGTALAGLRRALRAFEPDPLPILGRLVSPDEAPGLWRLVEGLAERLGALKPNTIVVGLTEGFFVSAGVKILEPTSETLTGRTLYVPLPYLPLLRLDELASIIGHELSHFAGGDTDYSLRFLPIYAGVGRSLEAVAAGSRSAFLLSPAMRLGLFVMDRFHHAVRHWSRTREFAADAAGAGPTSPEAAARALLRTGAVGQRIAETLSEAAEHPNEAADDLVTAVLDRVRAHGLDDPAAHLEAEQAHPTDTHPPTRERLAKLVLVQDPNILADLLTAAATIPPRGGLGALQAYFADPTGLCRAATDDFLAVVKQRDEAFHAHLAAAAAEVEGDERVLRENSRPGAIILVVTGVVFIIAGLALLAFALPGLSSGEARLVAAVSVVGGILFAGLGAFRLRQGERAYLILRPDALAVPGLDRAIPWDDVADLDMTWHQTGMVTRLLLSPEAPFPERVPSACWAKLDAKRRIVTIAAGLPRKTTPRDFADLIGRYRQAAEARRLLAEREGSQGARLARG